MVVYIVSVFSSNVYEHPSRKFLTIRLAFDLAITAMRLIYIWNFLFLYPCQYTVGSSMRNKTSGCSDADPSLKNF